MSLDQEGGSGRAGGQLYRFLAELREHWGEVRFSLDGDWYERAHRDCERLCEEFGLTSYLRNGKNDLISQGIGTAAIGNEMGPTDDYTRVLANGMGATLLLFLDDLSDDGSLDQRDFLYPFARVRHSSDRHGDLVDRVRGLISWLVSGVPSSWREVIVGAQNHILMSSCNERWLRRKQIGFYLYTDLRVGTSAVAFTNAMRLIFTTRSSGFRPRGCCPSRLSRLRSGCFSGTRMTLCRSFRMMMPRRRRT